MTRINLVVPTELTNKHAMAEYHELPRVFTKVWARVDKGQRLKDVKIPTEFCLGTGHETFFFDKIDYLLERYYFLFATLRGREFSISQDKYWEVVHKAQALPFEWRENRWRPKPEDVYLSMSRLCHKSNIPKVHRELYSSYMKARL